MDGAFYEEALFAEWRFTSGAFVPRGASRVALCGPPYVALSDQKAPHRAVLAASGLSLT